MFAAVFMVRMEPTAETSFAVIRDRSKFEIATAAMIRMIATAIRNSIVEKLFCFVSTFRLSQARRCQFRFLAQIRYAALQQSLGQIGMYIC